MNAIITSLGRLSGRRRPPSNKKPDLVVSQLSVQGQLFTGEMITFSATITNQGNATAGVSSTRIEIVGVGRLALYLRNHFGLVNPLW